MENLNGTKYILSLLGLSLVSVLIAKTEILALIGVATLGVMIGSLLLTAKRAQAIGWNGLGTTGLYFLFAILGLALPVFLLVNMVLVLTLTFKNGNKQTK